MEQHFRPTVADAGYDVVSDTRIFGTAGLEWEELSFSVNGTRWGSDRPAFPLLQAEKVLSLPLDTPPDERLSLPADWHRYGRRTTMLCGRVRSRRSDAIALQGHRLDRRRAVHAARLQTVQTRLSSPVVSNEEIQAFEPVKDEAGHDIWLPARIDSKQIVLIAGRNLLVEKAVVSPTTGSTRPTSTERRQSARSSDRIMFRETDAGLRNYVKDTATAWSAIP